MARYTINQQRRLTTVEMTQFLLLYSISDVSLPCTARTVTFQSHLLCGAGERISLVALVACVGKCGDYNRFANPKDT